MKKALVILCVLICTFGVLVSCKHDPAPKDTRTAFEGADLAEASTGLLEMVYDLDSEDFVSGTSTTDYLEINGYDYYVELNLTFKEELKSLSTANDGIWIVEFEGVEEDEGDSTVSGKMEVYVKNGKIIKTVILELYIDEEEYQVNNVNDSMAKIVECKDDLADTINYLVLNTSPTELAAAYYTQIQKEGGLHATIDINGITTDITVTGAPDPFYTADSERKPVSTNKVVAKIGDLGTLYFRHNTLTQTSGSDTLPVKDFFSLSFEGISLDTIDELIVAVKKLMNIELGIGIVVERDFEDTKDVEPGYREIINLINSQLDDEDGVAESVYLGLTNIKLGSADIKIKVDQFGDLSVNDSYKKGRTAAKNYGFEFDIVNDGEIVLDWTGDYLEQKKDISDAFESALDLGAIIYNLKALVYDTNLSADLIYSINGLPVVDFELGIDAKGVVGFNEYDDTISALEEAVENAFDRFLIFTQEDIDEIYDILGLNVNIKIGLISGKTYDVPTFIQAIYVLGSSDYESIEDSMDILEDFFGMDDN